MFPKGVARDIYSPTMAGHICTAYDANYRSKDFSQIKR
jgi:hypothetical protein